MSKHVTHGFHLVEGKSNHAMEDYFVAEFKQVDHHELGLFAIFDGHLSNSIPDYLRSHLFSNIINEVQRPLLSSPFDIIFMLLSIMGIVDISFVNLFLILYAQIARFLDRSKECC